MKNCFEKHKQFYENVLQLALWSKTDVSKNT